MSDSPLELVFHDATMFVFANAPHCTDCSRVLDPSVAVLPDDAPPLTFDIAVTLDGAVLVTEAFRAASAEVPGVHISPVDGSGDLGVLQVDPVVRLEPFDSHVTTGPECDTCRHPRYVTRSGPMVLEPDEVLPDGFSRSDVALGDTADFGPQQPIHMRPAVLVDRPTARRLKGADLLGIHVIAQP